MMPLTDTWSRRLRKQALDLGLYGHADYTRFVVVGRSRVGSNLLRGLLNAHPGIAAYGEIFRDRESFDWDHMGYFQSRGMRVLAQRDPVRFLHSKVLGRYPTFIGAVGFKLFYYHARSGVHAPVWPSLRERADLRVIHLKRRNLLQTHLSRKRATMTGRWVDTAGKLDSSQAIELDYQECLDDFVQTRAWEEECDQFFADHPVLQVEYERLAHDPVAEGRVVQEFLEVEPCALSPATFRQTRDPLSAVITNYAELRERFGGTAWAEFFTE